MFGYSLVFVIADFVNAILIRAIGQKLQIAYSQSLKSLNLYTISKSSGNSMLCKEHYFFEILMWLGWFNVLLTVSTFTRRKITSWVWHSKYKLWLTGIVKKLQVSWMVMFWWNCVHFHLVSFPPLFPLVYIALQS